MSKPSPILRIERALQAENPHEALLLLAGELKVEGMSQQEMYDLFNAQLLHYREPNESLYDAIADTMDRIVGWCRPGLRLFDSELRTEE